MARRTAVALQERKCAASARRHGGRDLVAALSEFVGDVRGGAYREQRHVFATDPAELEAFRRALALEGD